MTNPLRGMHYGKYWRPFVWSVWSAFFAQLKYELFDRWFYRFMTHYARKWGLLR